MAASKYRDFLFLVYPESAPEMWQEQLYEAGASFAVSPLHDKDTYSKLDVKRRDRDIAAHAGDAAWLSLNPAIKEGDAKKAHYHVMYHHSGPATVKSVIAALNGMCPDLVKYVQPCYQGTVAAFEYFTHKNNPDKAQYAESDIFCSPTFTVPRSDEDKKNDEELKKASYDARLLALSRDNGIHTISALVGYILEQGDIEFLSYCRSHSHWVSLIIAADENNTHTAQPDDVEEPIVAVDPVDGCCVEVTKSETVEIVGAPVDGVLPFNRSFVRRRVPVYSGTGLLSDPAIEVRLLDSSLCFKMVGNDIRFYPRKDFFC